MFFGRDTYRRRRAMDAAKLAPFVGVFLFIVPVLWSAGTSTTAALVFVFSVWCVLIALAAFLSTWLTSDEADDGPVDRLNDGGDGD